MSPLWLVPAELVIIGGGILAALIVGPDRSRGRHRLNRRTLREAELVAVDEFLGAIRASTPMRQE